MVVIIHDLEEEVLQEYLKNINKDIFIISDKGCIHNCIGCFGCWIKTPGVCVLKDGYEKMGEILAKADKVIIISKCVYGGYSPFVKNVLDRSISFLLPFFKIKRNETHHKQRYKNRYLFSVYFYGESISKKEKDTAKALVKANGINFYVLKDTVYFYDSIPQLFKESSLCGLI